MGQPIAHRCLAVVSLLLAVAAAAVAQGDEGGVYAAGNGTPPVVVLVDSLGELQRSWVDNVAEARGGAIGMVAGDVFIDTQGSLSTQLTAALVDNGFDSADTTYPVVGFGDAARHAILLSYDNWPVAVAVTPDLNPETAPLPTRDTPVSETETAPILLIIADVDTNGPFVTETEEALDAAGIHWETIRYGGVSQDFYTDTSDTGVGMEVWERAFRAISSFLRDASMGGTVGSTDPGDDVPAGVTVESPFTYMDGEAELEGFLAYPTAVTPGMKLPAVVVLPDWDGLNDYEFKRVRMLAEMGYVAFGADIYDLDFGTTLEDVEERAEYFNEYSGDPAKYVQRFRAAVDAVKALSYVDGEMVGLTGYCFGGSGVVFDVLRDSSLKLDVSFHGSLNTKPDITTTPPMQPYVSYQSGGADETAEDIEWLQNSLSSLGGSWDITRYSMVEHGFTVWAANAAYHARADGRSWAATRALLREIMPSPLMSPPIAHYAVGTSPAGIFYAHGVVVVLVEDLGVEEQGWVQAFAMDHGAAVAFTVSDIFPGADVTSQRLLHALEVSGVMINAQPEMFPVIGFGAAATHAVLLSYAGWPVSVAVCPDLDPASAYAWPEEAIVGGEADAAPILMLVSDVDVNGPFVTSFERTLDSVGIHWETVRYGGTQPDFFLSLSTDFQPVIWARAYDAILSFLLDNSKGGTSGTKDPGAVAPSNVRVQSTFTYMDGETELEGYLAYPTIASESIDIRIPVVIVLPDWTGLDEYEFKRVRMLANMGYVALGADIYDLPLGTTVETIEDRRAYVGDFLGNPPQYVQRIRAAVDAVKALPYVDDSRVGLTGYCFGGSGVVFDVFDDSSLQVDVSFHGGLSDKPNITTTPPMKPYLSYQSGGADESPEDIEWLQNGLSEIGGEWDITRYSQVRHGFTEWGPAGSAYHPRADGRSWAAMKALFEEFLPVDEEMLPRVQPRHYKVGVDSQVAGPGEVVVLLVEELGDEEKGWANSMALSHGGALALVVSDVFPHDEVTPNLLLEALFMSEVRNISPDNFYIVGFGVAARHAMLLSFEEWPVVVAVCPNLNPVTAPLPERNSPVEEGDEAPLLLVISDVMVNGEFVTDTEELLDAAGIHWETVRYGGTTPDFYSASSPNFNPPAWGRAYGVITSFLEDAKAGGTIGTADPGSEPPDGITVESPFAYSDGDVELEGYLAYPTDAVAQGRTLPAVVVLPDWTGLDEYEFKRVRMLAAMGYFAIGADIYDLPIGTTVEDFGERGAYVDEYRGNPPKYVQRIRAAVDAIKSRTFVDENRIGLTGYCFGGSGVVFDVFDDSSLQVDVSFHGGLGSKPDITTSTPMQPYLSYQSGGADESPADILWLQTRLQDMGGEWDITRYSQVPHGFSEWSSDRYHARADGRSWSAMKALFEEFLRLEPTVELSTAELSTYTATPEIPPLSESTNIDAIVLLVDAIADEERGWANSMAGSLGAAVTVMIASEVFLGGQVMGEQLLHALRSTSYENPSMERHPVVGFGSAARHAILLSYDNWPVTVAIGPDLNPTSAPLPTRPPVVSVTDATGRPILLLVTDVEVNGPFVTLTEEALDEAGIHWETIRYGRSSPEFFRSDSPSFMPAIWARAYEAVTSFLLAATDEGFSGTTDPGAEVPSGVTTDTLTYVDGDAEIEGYLAYPTVQVRAGQVLPTVLVLPDWDGLNEYEFRRARMLASLGYVALGVDIYGLPLNTTVESRTERVQKATYWRSNPDLYVQRIRAALESAKALTYTDSNAMGLTGYCFGGSGVVFDAFINSTLQVDVSFHGGLANKPTITATPSMQPYLSYQSGGADESLEDIEWLQSSLSEMGGEWDITRYSRVQHGFTVWGPSSSAYHPRADGRSWAAMKSLFEEHMPLPPAPPSPPSPVGIPDSPPTPSSTPNSPPDEDASGDSGAAASGLACIATNMLLSTALLVALWC